METLENPACTVVWAARLCRSWLSPKRVIWIPNATTKLWKEKAHVFSKVFFFFFFFDLIFPVKNNSNSLLKRWANSGPITATNQTSFYFILFYFSPEITCFLLLLMLINKTGQHSRALLHFFFNLNLWVRVVRKCYEKKKKNGWVGVGGEIEMIETVISATGNKTEYPQIIYVWKRVACRMILPIWYEFSIVSVAQWCVSGHNISYLLFNETDPDPVNKELNK